MSCENRHPCTCTTTTCPRYGKCCDCVVHHREKGGIPGCFFTPEGEALRNRSYETFFRDRGGV